MTACSLPIRAAGGAAGHRPFDGGGDCGVFQRPARAIMDGNVKRVFARVFGIDTYPGEKKTEEAMWRRAEALLPEEGIESYTQGLMDMGATLCTRSSPSCERCPMQALRGV
jgi:adenine-specific DNA glycosylase